MKTLFIRNQNQTNQDECDVMVKVYNIIHKNINIA